MSLVQGRNNETVIPRHIALLNLEKQNIVKIIWTSGGSAGFWLGNGNLTVNSGACVEILLLSRGEIDNMDTWLAQSTEYTDGNVQFNWAAN